MSVLIHQIFSRLANILNSLCEDIGRNIQKQNYGQAANSLVLLLLTLLVLTLLVIAVFVLCIRFWEWLVIPAILVSLAVHYSNTPEEAPKPKEVPPIEAIRSRAESTYPSMRQTAFVLFSELSTRFQGQQPPMSLSSVESDSHYTITPSMVTVYHFSLSKGNCVTDAASIKEFLEHILVQKLNAHDLPLSIKPTYTAADGQSYSSIVVDGVHDFGISYRVDLVITNEAEAQHLKAKTRERMTGCVLDDRNFEDEDFR